MRESTDFVRVRVALRFFFWTRRVFFFFGVFDDGSVFFSLRRPLRLLLSASIDLLECGVKKPHRNFAKAIRVQKKKLSHQRRHFFLRDKLIHTLTRTNAHPTREAHTQN